MAELSTMATMMVLTFLVASMLSLGMQTTVADLRALLASRSFLARTLLANFLVVPILGVALILLLPLQPHVAGALLLLACTPGGVSAIQFTGQVKGSAASSVAVMCLLAGLAVFISPLLLKLVLPADVRLVIPYGGALLFFLVYLIAPLLVGMLLLGSAPDVAAKLSKLVALVGIVAFVGFMVATGSVRQPTVGEMGGVAVAAMLLFIALSMAVGWFMGGSARDAQRILATATSMRNAALCIAIVEASAPGHAILVPLIAFSLLMVPTNLLFSIYNTVQAKRRAREAP
ncbi:hypothetical protein [uncultured Piscinibacter sp.]|uniref:bile acid:sodium symporter family protein n=1 Tax=uncultured Piscinibacter sp. TaxID=1131835 RepID=UPI00260C1D10|nr:hypothetical protein [uncultured Piscinibacter sp.]